MPKILITSLKDYLLVWEFVSTSILTTQQYTRQSQIGNLCEVFTAITHL